MINIENLRHFKPDFLMHCTMCLSEKPDQISARDYSRLSFGIFSKDEEPEGIYLQLWCDRHDCNVVVVHIETEAWSHYDDVPLGVAMDDATGSSSR